MTGATSSKRVSFSESSVVILFPRIPKRDKSKFWISSAELALSRVMWTRAVQQVQAMDMKQSNNTDASDYMGLEKYLTKEQAEHCSKQCKHHIQSIIDRQYSSSCDELAAYAQSQSRTNVARSHTIAVFYASRHFEEPKRNSVLEQRQRHCNETSIKTRGPVRCHKMNSRDDRPKIIRFKNKQVAAVAAAPCA